MQVPPFINTEDARLAALSEYGVDHEEDLALDRIVRLAANLFDVPIALVSLVERTRQVFPAKVGLEACETDRDVSFCAHAIVKDDVLVVPDVY